MRSLAIFGVFSSAAFYSFDDLSHPILRFAEPSFANGTEPADGPNAFDVAQALLSLPRSGTNSRNVNDFAPAFLGLAVMDLLDLELSNETWGSNISMCNTFKDKCCAGNGTWSQTRFASYEDQNVTVLNKGNGLLDMTFLYGPDEATALSLRDTDGKLRTDASSWGLPHNNNSFVTGDRRVNEHPIFAAVTTLFLREHNRLAQEQASANPTWTSDQIYNEARRWNIAFWQKIVYYEFLGALSGGALNGNATYYDSSVSVNVTDLFVVTARAMPITLSETVLRLDAFNNEVPARHVPLVRAVNKGFSVLAGDPDAVLRGMLMQAPPPAVNFPSPLPAVPGSFFFRGDASTVATAILEGRDIGLRSLLAFTKGLSNATSTNITPASSWAARLGSAGASVAAALQNLYGGIANADPLAVLLACSINAGSSIDNLFSTAMRMQLQRARDGDPLYFEHDNVFSVNEERVIFSTHLSDILLRNTAILQVPNQAFFRKSAVEEVQGMAVTSTPIVFSPRHDDYAFSEVPSPLYKMSWTVFTGADGSQHIRFFIEARTLGWVGWGIGVSGNQAMLDTDMVFATVIGGNASVTDRHSLGITFPQPDTRLGGQDNLYDTGAAEVNGFTQVWFSRALEATEIHDRTIPDYLVEYTYSFNGFGLDSGYHGAARGIATTQFVRKPVLLSSALVIALRFFASLMIAIFVLVGILTWVKRNAVVFKAASPPFCLYFILGAIISISAIYPLTSESNCTSSLWLLCFGLSMMFAAIFVKNLRLAHIFNSTNVQAMRKQWSPRLLASMVTLVSAVPTIILIVMEASDPARVVHTPHPTIAYSLKVECVQNYRPVWIGLLISYFGLLLGFGLHIATSLWSVKYEAFNEAGGIILAVNQFAILAIVVVPALLSLDFDENVLGAIECVAILFAVSFAVAALFAWKVWIVLRSLHGSELASLKKEDSQQQPDSTSAKAATYRTTGGSAAFLPRAGRQPSRERQEKRSGHSNHSNDRPDLTPNSHSPNNSQNNDDQHAPATELTSIKRPSLSPRGEPAAACTAPIPTLCLIVTDADKEAPSQTTPGSLDSV